MSTVELVEEFVSSQFKVNLMSSMITHDIANYPLSGSPIARSLRQFQIDDLSLATFLTSTLGIVFIQPVSPFSDHFCLQNFAPMFS